MPTCKFKLYLGKKHWRYAPSSYDLCVTPTQAETLFGGKKPKAEGCGVFACVFPHKDPDKVVKITRDASDVAGLTRTQGLPQAPKMFARFQLASSSTWTHPKTKTFKHQEWPDQPTPYALVLERVRPLKGKERDLWNTRIKQMAEFEKEISDKAKLKATGTKTLKPGIAKTIRASKNTLPFAKTVKSSGSTSPWTAPMVAAMAKAVCPRGPGQAECQARVKELSDAIDALQSRGVTWTDIHAGNIGVGADGRWKVLDMGAANTPLDSMLPQLAGTRRRRRR